MARKSLAANSLLSGGQKLLSIIFPLITFPYISRVLDVDDIGKVGYTSSIISYFILIAGLGITNYATREGAKIRDDKEKLNAFVNEIFSINIITTLISYFFLGLIMVLFNGLHAYTLLLLIQSLTIVGTTLGVNWLYAIEEDFLYITIRTLLVQIVSLVLMFLFIHSPEDYVRYAWITVLSAVGGNVFNFWYSRKYVSFRLVRHLNLNKHIKPILIIFASSIAVTIYVNSDMTLLGILSSEYSVGLYTRSTKIYTIIKQMVAAMIVVALPNLASDLGCDNGYRKYCEKANLIFHNVLLFTIPIGLGMLLTSKNIIYIIAGPKFSEAATSLSILGISCIFAVLSSFLTYCCLLPLGYERIQMLATIGGALINIVLNFILLPDYAQNGAAFTTLLAESIVFCIGTVFLFKRDIKYRQIFKVTFKDASALIVGGGVIVLTCLSVTVLISNLIVQFVIEVALCAVLYFGCLKLFGFTTLDSFIRKLLRKHG